jgi:hypothetical protein
MSPSLPTPRNIIFYKVSFEKREILVVIIFNGVQILGCKIANPAIGFKGKVD